MRPWLPIALAAACLAQPAAAFDLTGTWEGKQTCKGLSAGEKTSFSFPSMLRITQTGTELALKVVSDSGTDVYNGIGIDGALKPEAGEAYFVHCGTGDVPAVGEDAFDESGRAVVKTKAEIVGRLPRRDVELLQRLPRGLHLQVELQADRHRGPGRRRLRRLGE